MEQKKLNRELLAAAVDGDTKSVEECLARGADVNYKNRLGQSALYLASRRGWTETVSRLLDHGADVNTKDDEGNTPYDVAANGDIRELLMMHVQQEQDVVLPGIDDPVEFKSLLKQGGTYRSYGNRIYLAGACSVGKSTLASLLIGDEIPLVWKSTDGLQIFFGRNGIHLEERKMVPLDKDEENQNILANVLRGQPGMDKSQQDINLQQQAISVSTGLESTKEAAAAQLMSGVPSKQQIMTERKTQQEEKPMQKFDIFEFTSIHDDIKKELRSGKYKVKIAPSDLVDFGGQKSYDMTHQLFIQGKGTFTLIFDGRKELQDRLAEYPQGEVTTASILKHWVDSILTYCGEDDDDILPVILFVATHRDTLKEDEQSKRMTDFKQGLTEMFQNHEHKTRIKYDNIFFINSRDRNDPEVIRLQTAYVNIAFQQKSWGKPMPMAWVPLELQMSKMRSRNISIISKDDLIKVNEQNNDLALTSRQLDEFLRVQHSLGKILYFEGQGLADYVIVQPTTLVDILRSFITDEMFWPKDETLKGILKAMTETGKIKKEDLFQIWSQEEFNQHMADKDFKVFVAQTMTYLDLLVEPKLSNTGEGVSDFYLVPCMVKRQITANVDENIDKDKMICLSYLLKSTVPSALSFKLIGAALNVWPLKETGDDVCLYHQAAILSIDKSNELHILVRKDRVIVYLVNEQSKDAISPDIASCAQECLTLTLKTVLEFYHKSFGKKVSNSNLAGLFEIEVGEKCVNDICYISLSEAQKKKSWICKFGTEHKTKTPLYWTFDKEQEACQPDCTGFEALSSHPNEQHLVRLAVQIDNVTCKAFVLVLGLPDLEWKHIEQSERDVTMINFKALIKWKTKLESKRKKPTFKMLQEALYKTEQDVHLLCKIFREDTLLLELQHKTLLKTPDEATLKELSQTVGNCALHLGVELGLKTAEIERTINKYSKDIFDQNYDILTKWRNSGRNTTLRMLMKVLQIVDSRGLTYLDEKFKIGFYIPE